MVPPTGIEPVMTGYQPIVIPFNYRGINLEHRVRFELTVLRICNPLHWASLPPVHTNLLRDTIIVV